MAIENLTQKEAAARLGISASTLRRYDVPRGEDGTYPWPAVKWAFEGVEPISQGEAATRLGISTAWVRELTRREVLSRNEDGTYPWPKIQEEHEAFQDEAEDERGAGFGDEGYEKARARLTKEKADTAEMENRRRRGELVEMDDVERMTRAPLERVALVIDNTPNRYGPILAKMAKVPLAQAKKILSDIGEMQRAELRGLVEEIGDAAA